MVAQIDEMATKIPREYAVIDRKNLDCEINVIQNSTIEIIPIINAERYMILPIRLKDLYSSQKIFKIFIASSAKWTQVYGSPAIVLKEPHGKIMVINYALCYTLNRRWFLHKKSPSEENELPQFVRTVQKHPMVGKIRF